MSLLSVPGFSFESILELAKNGDANCMFMAAYIYLNGEVTERNYAEAEYWAEKAIENGNAEGYVMLAKLYSSTEFDKFDSEYSTECLVKYAEEKPEIDYGILRQLFIENNVPVLDAIRLFEKSLEEQKEKGEDLQSAVFLAHIYADEEFGVINVEKAVEYFEMAEDNLDADDMLSYAMVIEEIEGEDSERAKEWYINSADEGNSDAAEICAERYDYVTEEDDDGDFDFSSLFSSLDQANECLANGDYQKAYELTKKAAEEMDPTAAFNMGLFELNGLPTGKPDYAVAIEWMKKSAEWGDEDAQRFVNDAGHLGEYYLEALKGDADAMGKFAFELIKVRDAGTPGDFCDISKVIYEWAEKSAKLGSSYGYNALGSAYEFGLYVDEDEEKALENYRKAAEMNNDLANIRLGILYMQGKMVEENRKLGLKYMKKAADLGSHDAIYNIANIYQSEGDYEKSAEYFSKIEDTLTGKEMYDYACSLESIYGTESEITKEHYIKSMNLGYPPARFYVSQEYPDVELSEIDESNPFAGMFDDVSFDEDDEED